MPTLCCKHASRQQHGVRKHAGIETLVRLRKECARCIFNTCTAFTVSGLAHQANGLDAQLIKGVSEPPHAASLRTTQHCTQHAPSDFTTQQHRLLLTGSDHIPGLALTVHWLHAQHQQCDTSSCWQQRMHVLLGLSDSFHCASLATCTAFTIAVIIQHLHRLHKQAGAYRIQAA